MEPRRTLTLGMEGDDVALVHRAMAAMGIDIADEERAARRFGPTTRDAVMRLQMLSGMEPTGEVDPPTLELAEAALARLHARTRGAGPVAAGPKFAVEGVVTDPDGQPLRGATVVAFERDVRASREVGRTNSDALGRYYIPYACEAENPDLQVHVIVEGQVRYTSPVHFNVGKRVDIPLPLGGPERAAPSELAAVVETLATRLGRLPPEEIVENPQHQDLSFLAGDTGFARERIAFYSVAARLARSTDLPRDLFYALLRQDVPDEAETLALAASESGVDLDRNAARLLEAMVAAAPDVRRRAVEAAIANNVVPASYAKRAEEDLARLSKLGTQAALSTRVGMGKTPIGDVLTAAAIPPDKQQTFVELYAAATGPTRGFWRALAKNSAFTKPEVATLRFAVNVGRFTRGHMPLVETLIARRQQGQIKGARDLARLKASDWKALITGSGGGTPAGIPANLTASSPEEAIDVYAHLLERNFERAYPTTAFSARLAEDDASPIAARQAVARFLDANPQFNLFKTNVDRYLKDYSGPPQPDRDELRESLLTSQRVLKLTSRYVVARPLLADGIRSAQQIYAMGRDPFVAAYAAHADIGAAQAARVYAKAEQTYALALNLALQLYAPIGGINPVSIPSLAPTPAVEEALEGFPNLQTLFGSLDMCACKHCRSVLSPAAYLADLLLYLSHRPTNGGSAKDVLLARRPDIAQIELSCANTNTVLPYIDLVNELLEDAVAPPADPVAAARARQTTLTTPELNANPQYANENAYITLASAVYPWTLPFDLPLSEARTYLGHLGVDRVALMQAFQAPAEIPSPEAIAIAVEGLGLSETEADIITGGPLAAGNESWDYWGLAENGNNVRDPVDPTIVVAGTWLDVLSHVRILLHRSGLTYETLTRLLNTLFINDGGAVRLESDPPDSCDLGATTVVGLTQDVLDRLHRFVRLLRRLGWDPYELDAAIALFQAAQPRGLAQLNTTLLRQLHAIKIATKRFRISVATAVALQARIDTRIVPRLPGEETDRRALYHELFQNRAVLNPVDAIFALDAAGTEIAAIAANPQLADHRPTLIAAFEISDADLALAIDALTNGALTLANLSTLYRHVVLARGLRLSIRELLSLLALVERELPAAPFFERIDPFDAGRPELLALFCHEVDRIRRTRFSITQLDYLLRHVYEPSSAIPLDDIAVGTLLKSIRDGLIKIAAENQPVADPTGSEVRRHLAKVLDQADLDALVAVLDGSSTLAQADQEALVAALLGPYMDAAAAQAALVGGAAVPAGATRYEYVLTRILDHFRRTLGTGFAVQQLSDALRLPIATVADLVAWFPSDAGPLQPVIEDFLALPGVARDPALEAEPVARDEAGFGAYFDRYTALDKGARLIAGFGLTTEDTAWLRDHGVAEGWLDPRTLPLAVTADAQGRYWRWSRLAAAAALKTTLPSDGTPATSLMDLARTGATKSATFAALAARTQWAPESLAVLAGDPADLNDRGSLSLVYPDDYTSERALGRLVPAFALLRRLGIAADVSGWIGAAVTAEQAHAIKQSVKAKYSVERWATVAKPLRDVLREQQRDALVAYLLAHPPAGVGRWFDANDVYAHFLVDVEMSACQGTSRIVLANASIQLFVQRCILNLEPDVTVDANTDVDWLQWKWMSRYRVWEANRKVFLYPENWLEPQWRRDKSPPFKDLENDLLQNEVTKETAETAIRTYLEKLDAVARLEVMGTYYQAADPSVLHVVARKQGDPPTYYYRQWIDSSRWTAWTKIDLDIVSDHVLPVVWNRRLYLFWAIVTKKPDRTQAKPKMELSSSPPPDPKIHLELQLAWSEFRDNKWQAKQTAPQTLVIQTNRDPFDVTLKSSIADPLLRIDVFRFDGASRVHTAEFVLGGVGNSVEAFAVSTGGLADVGPEARAIGVLDATLRKGTLTRPTSSIYDSMAIIPQTSGSRSPARPRVSPLYTSYDLYGVLESEIVLNEADRYRLLVPHQLLRFDSSLPFFYADGLRSYFVVPTIYYQSGNYFTTTAPPYVYHPFYRAEYVFYPFYHAFVPLFIRELARGGVDRLFARRLQVDPNGVRGTAAFDFVGYYDATDRVNEPYPVEGVDFDPQAGYAIYNWELFFHVPFLIGQALSRNQKFEEAKRWYEYIFNPTSATDDPVPERYWITKPFYERSAADYLAQLIQNLSALINARDSEAEHQVAVWRANPFDPHVIAGMRQVAYQRAIVMKYIDNLIAWGDHLFRQDTMESVNEATQLYVLAAELLGPRPQIVPAKHDSPPRTFAELEPELDAFSNAVAAAENALPPVRVNVSVDPATPKLPVIPPLYFCIPSNEQLLGYWDTVADRLFKIRHCMNIEGVERQLALFAPPIDPGMLVRAAAAGLDLGSILSDTNAAPPPYRFRVIVREAIEVAETVRALGVDLLVALEKRDAERLALLRAGGERTLQDRMRAIRQRAVEEAEQQIEVLGKVREVVAERQRYFATRKDELMNTWEAAALLAATGSMIAEAIAIALNTTSGASYVIPDLQFGASGAGGSPHFTLKIGGTSVGGASDGWAKAARATAAVLQTTAQMCQTTGAYQRRKEEWTFQHDVATRELDQVAAQVEAAAIRRDLARMERDHHDLVAKLAADTDELLQGKFTNQELYEWMIAQTSATYFQAYQLAYTVAKRAEQCFRRELGVADSSFVQFGYWDSLKKGLLAGDKLLHDVRRMEAAYFAQHARELELTKHVSLLSIDPFALVDLRSTGTCTVTLPELLFDLENPGHYLRRLKTVGITVPCVVGPYTGVSLTLTLLDNHIRTSTDTAPAYPRDPANDDRFLDDPGGTSAVVTSHAQNDSGLFELRLEDERYLPFEGAGAVSTWRLRLNPVYPQFDYATISDVVLHLRYTARDGGVPLAAAASQAVRDELNAVALAEGREGLYRMISARQEFGTAWYKFLNPPAGQDQALTIETPPERFAFFTRGLDLSVNGIDVFAKLEDPGDYDLEITRPGAAAQIVALSADPALGGVHHFQAHPLAPVSPIGRAPAPPPAPPWTFRLRRAGAPDFRSLVPSEVEDLVLVLRYEVTP